VGVPSLYPIMPNPLLPPYDYDGYSKYVENEFKRIVGENNIRRMSFFNNAAGSTTLIDRSPNKQNGILSLPVGSIEPTTVNRAKTLNFNATTKYWEYPDADDLSFGNGTTDSAFSIVSCINPNVIINSQTIVSKYDLTTGNTKKEYILHFFTSKLYMYLMDNSSNGIIGRLYNTALTADVGTWQTYIGTYDGSGLSSGVGLYRSGIKVDDANFQSGTYTAMENSGAKVGNYYLDSSGNKSAAAAGNSKYAFQAIVSGALTQAQVTAIDFVLRKFVGVI
jgi:hypothetical protein